MAFIFLCSSVVALVLGTGEAADDDAAVNHHENTNKLCDKVDTSSFFYTQGGEEIVAQAYKPNAPKKTSICDDKSSSSSSTTNDNTQLHKVAHRSFWRSDYKDLVPIFIRGNLYATCNNGSSAALKNNDVIMEVWQPRPDGTYSSIRPGVEEGDCRASVPITTTTTANHNIDNTDDGDNSSLMGRVEFETFAPGSIGILNGLVPSSSRDYPPYKPGAIHMFLNIAGYQPLLSQLSMSELNDWIPQKSSKGRFKLSNGKEKRKTSNYNNDGETNIIYGMEIQSVTPKSQSGYKLLAIEVEVNFFLVGNDQDTIDNRIEDIFCSHSLHRGGGLSWMPSFFKEPISICSATYMDFFAL